jgi:autotransporter-associated beta strand protein
MKMKNTHISIGRFRAGCLIILSLGLATVTTVRASYQDTVLADDPLAFYPLNLAVDTGSSATDISGNGNNGTYVNIADGFNNETGPSAFITNAVSFDGSSEFVDLSTGTNIGILNFGGKITLEAWVQSGNPSQNLGDIVAKGYDVGDGDELQMRVNQNQYQGGTYSYSAGGEGVGGGTTSTNWVYQVVSNDGTNWNLYLNGVLITTSPDPVGALDFTDPWAIGNGSSSGYGRLFQGNLTEVAIYNYALSPSQVYAHYFAGEYGASPTNSVPIITAQPVSQLYDYPGESATFSVQVLSALAVTNQWYQGNMPLNGQTNLTLTLTNLQLRDSGSYTVTIGNSVGTTNSVAVTLDVNVPGPTLEWSGNGNSGTWDTGISANWISNSQETVFSSTDGALFNDTAGAPTMVSLSGTNYPSLVTVDSTNNDFTFNGSGAISGGASLLKDGPSILTIDAANNFTGSVTIEGGDLILGSSTALGSTSGVTVTNGATLDFNGYDLAGTPLFVSGAGVDGQGALVNNGGAIYNGSCPTNITITGDVTFGGPNRWDMGSSTGGFLSTGGKPYSVSITGNPPGYASGQSYFEWHQLTCDTNLADINILGGLLGVVGSTTLGNPSATLTVYSNAYLVFYNANQNVLFNKQLVLQNDGTLENGGGANVLISPVTLGLVSGDSSFFNIGGTSVSISNVVSGVGNLVKSSSGSPLYLSSINTYTGGTFIDNGTLGLLGAGSISDSSDINIASGATLDASGRTDQTLTLASGQTLQGSGNVTGNLTVSSGADLSPAGAGVTGTLTVSGAVSLAGTTTLDVDEGNSVSDLITGAASITYGGNLIVSNLTGTLAAGDSFQVFSAGSYSGSFGSITPAPGPGLTWDLSGGMLTVVVATEQPSFNSVTVSGTNLVFSGTNGLASGNYFVLTATNLAMRLADWTVLATNSFGADGAFSFTNSVNHSAPAQFYLIEVQ